MPHPLTNLRVDLIYKLQKAGFVDFIEPILLSSYFNLLCQILAHAPSLLRPSQLEWMANYLDRLSDQTSNVTQLEIINIFAPSVIWHSVRIIPIIDATNPILSQSVRTFISAFPELASTACESIHLPPDIHRKYFPSSINQNVTDYAAMWHFISESCRSRVTINNATIELSSTIKPFLAGDYDANPKVIVAILNKLFFEFHSDNNIYTIEQRQIYLKQLLLHLFEKKYRTISERIKFIKLFLISYAQEHKRIVTMYNPDQSDYSAEDNNFRWWVDLILFSDLFIPPGALRRLLIENPDSFLLAAPGGYNNNKVYLGPGHYVYSIVWDALLEHQFELALDIDDWTLSFYFNNIKRLLALQDVLSREAACTQTLPGLTKFPLSWQLEPPEILTDHENIILFEQFIDFLQAVNAEADTFHQRNIDLLLDRHGDSIVHLIDILGKERTLNYLKSKVFKNLVKLETLLIHLSSIGYIKELCQRIFASFPSSVKDDPSQLETFVKYAILRASSEVQTAKLVTNLGTGEIGKQLSKAIKINDEAFIALKATPDIFLKNLIITLLNQILQDKELEEYDNEKLLQFIEKHSIHRLFQILEAANHMVSHDNYRAIFLALVKCDLTGKDTDKFLHNTTQENELGLAIAAHNDRIQQKLRSYGVDPQSALNYSESYQFLVEPSGAISLLDRLYGVLRGHLKKLESAANNLLESEIINEKDRNRLNSIIRNIEQLEKNIQAKLRNGNNKSAAVYDVLTQEGNIQLLSKITSSCSALIPYLDKIVSNNESAQIFREFAQHLINDQNEIKEKKSILSNSTAVKGNRQSLAFTVQSWNKSDATTFFLGDEVGCCLSTSGPHFYAMVQRRLDDGILFFVVIDNETKRPIALAWNYIAEAIYLETQETHLALITNFYEVHPKHLGMSKYILNGLLSFTEKFLAANPNINSHYIAQHDYGPCHGLETCYPAVSVEIVDKIAGAFNPAVSSYLGNTSTSFTADKYYLVSLQNKKFHRFCAKVLADQKEKFPIVTPYDLITIVWDTLSTEEKTTISLDNFRAIIITEHAEYLQKMFDNTAESSLASIVEQFYKNKVQAFKQSHASDKAYYGMFVSRIDSVGTTTPTVDKGSSTPMSRF